MTPTEHRVPARRPVRARRLTATAAVLLGAIVVASGVAAADLTSILEPATVAEPADRLDFVDPTPVDPTVSGIPFNDDRRPRVFIATHGNNELANNAALDDQWRFVQQHVDGIWGNAAGISFDEAAALIAKLQTRTILVESPMREPGLDWPNINNYYGRVESSGSLALRREAVVLYTNEPSRWNGRTIADARQRYGPDQPVGQRFDDVYTLWQPQNFNELGSPDVVPGSAAYQAYVDGGGVGVECPLGACRSSTSANGRSLRQLICDAHAQNEPFIWFSSWSTSFNEPNWLESFKATYEQIAAEGLWRPDDVIMLINYQGAYPLVPETNPDGTSANTLTGLAHWALNQTPVDPSAQPDCSPYQTVP